MTLGILGAMHEETAAIHDLMANVQEIEYAGRNFSKGKIGDQDVVLVFSRWGKVAAAHTTSILREKFGIDRLIFTGVAGACDPKLNIGDILIATQLFQHDLDARPFIQQFEIPLLGLTHLDADPKLLEIAAKASKLALKNLAQSIPPSLWQQFNIQQPKAKLGIIATGDQFIECADRIGAIVTAMPETCAFEMEGAAVAQVCHDDKIPFVVVRTISDSIGNTHPIDCFAFIRELARFYSAEIVREFCRLL
jgi:adenosylhomocysteine nucleosidase